MKNQEPNNTNPTPKASLLLMEDNLCKRGSEIPRDSSVGVSSRIFYYYHESLDDGVPFKWEMQPGTPINPPPEEIIPPITPPPAHLSHRLPTPSISLRESNKHSLFLAKLKLWKWKDLRKKYFSRWSSHNVLLISRDYSMTARDGNSNSCGEFEIFEEPEDYRSSTSSTLSSSSSTDRRRLRLTKSSPDRWLSGYPLKN